MPPMIGQIELMPYGFAPRGWLFCDGSILSISQNRMLFDRIGSTFGGDGVTNFGLPNLTSVEDRLEYYDACWNYCDENYPKP